VNDNTEIDEISYEYAGDMYIKIINGFRVQYWLSYTSKVIMRYIKSYKSNYSPQIIDATGNPELSEAILDISYSSSKGFKEDWDNSINKIYIKDLIPFIRSSFNRHSRYVIGTKEYHNLYLSVLLSFTRGQEVYYDLTEETVEYLSFLITKIKLDIIKNIKETIIPDTENLLGMSQLLMLENCN
jgi:hypothetical protein